MSDFQKQLRQIVAGVVKNYEAEEIFFTKPGVHVPDRDAVVALLKDLRRIVFPGYFGNEALTGSNPEYFVGNMLLYLRETISSQLYAAFSYDDESLPMEQVKQKAGTVCDEFLARLPYIQEMLFKDVQAAFDGDPAAKSKADIILSYPGLFAVFVYRVAHELFVRQVPLIPRIMTEYAHASTGIDLHPGATIGEYFFMDHGTGIVVGETTVIGNHVKLYQGVTLGALSTRKGQQLAGVKRHPTIGDCVTIYSNASILGGETTIGANTVIGGSAFITESVPANTRVSIKSPELTLKGPSQDSGW